VAGLGRRDPRRCRWRARGRSTPPAARVSVSRAPRQNWPSGNQTCARASCAKRNKPKTRDGNNLPACKWANSRQERRTRRDTESFPCPFAVCDSMSAPTDLARTFFSRKYLTEAHSFRCSRSAITHGRAHTRANNHAGTPRSSPARLETPPGDSARYFVAMLARAVSSSRRARRARVAPRCRAPEFLNPKIDMDSSNCF